MIRFNDGAYNDRLSNDKPNEPNKRGWLRNTLSYLNPLEIFGEVTLSVLVGSVYYGISGWPCTPNLGPYTAAAAGFGSVGLGYVGVDLGFNNMGNKDKKREFLAGKAFIRSALCTVGLTVAKMACEDHDGFGDYIVDLFAMTGSYMLGIIPLALFASNSSGDDDNGGGDEVEPQPKPPAESLRTPRDRFQPTGGPTGGPRIRITIDNIVDQAA